MPAEVPHPDAAWGPTTFGLKPVVTRAVVNLYHPPYTADSRPSGRGSFWRDTAFPCAFRCPLPSALTPHAPPAVALAGSAAAAAAERTAHGASTRMLGRPSGRPRSQAAEATPAQAETEATWTEPSAIVTANSGRPGLHTTCAVWSGPPTPPSSEDEEEEGGEGSVPSQSRVQQDLRAGGVYRSGPMEKS